MIFLREMTEDYDLVMKTAKSSGDFVLIADGDSDGKEAGREKIKN